MEPYDNEASPTRATDDRSDPRDGDLICPHQRRTAPWQRITALSALRPDQERVAAVLADARLLLWTGIVEKRGDIFVWEIEVAPESLQSPLVDYTAYKQHGYLWHPSFAPDYDAAKETFRQAIARGDDRYQQEFRVQFRGRIVWLEEIARIAKTGPDRWNLSGVIREITEQKLARDAERQARRDADRLLQHAQCALWHATVTADAKRQLEWHVRLIPSGLQRSLFERLNHEGLMDLYDGFDAPQLPEMDARAREAMFSGAPGYQQEFAITRQRDRQTFWLREHVAITKIGDSEWSLSGVMIDVTAQKVAEQARQHTEVHLARLLDQLDCIVWHGELVLEADGEWHWQLSAPPSRLYRRLFNRDPQPPYHVLLWSAEDTPEYRDMDRAWRQAVATNAEGYEQEFRHIANGHEVWLHEVVTILRRSATQIQLAGVIFDITGRKQAEMALNAEKERLAVTLRAMDESVMTVDLQRRITYVNRSAEVLLQLSAAEMLGQPLDTIAPLRSGPTPQSLPWPEPKGPSVDLPADVELVRRHAPVVRIEGRVAPLHDPFSRSTGAVLVFRDVTERHLLQSHLQRASTLESVGVLAGGIAHDFNNILTALLANLSLAEMDAPPGSDLESYLREAHAATDRAAALAKQLLTFAKGGDPLLAAVDLGEAIQEVTHFSLRGTRVDYALDLAPDLWPARADRGQFAQIIQNLVLNAAQSMPNGGTIRIAAGNEVLRAAHASGLAPGRYVRLAVTDTGSGIPSDAVDKIFTPYFTTKAGGNGLGLAVVYSIVKKHHGSIDVHSALGHGTTFELLLPAAPTTAMTNAPSPRIPPRALPGRVLVMDDEPAILRVVAMYLRGLGLHVQTTTDGAQLVAEFTHALARGEPYDVVVMDLTVPGKMGGREAITELRRIDPTVQAIVASGYSSDPVLAHFADYGFSAMAAKPYDIVRLAEQIADLIEQRAAETGTGRTSDSEGGGGRDVQFGI